MFSGPNQSQIMESLGEVPRCPKPTCVGFVKLVSITCVARKEKVQEADVPSAWIGGHGQFDRQFSLKDLATQILDHSRLSK